MHAERRELGWLGGFLLAAATWVRLYDLGVDAPEAYTLPIGGRPASLVGLHRLWREPGTSYRGAGAGSRAGDRAEPPVGDRRRPGHAARTAPRLAPASALVLAGTRLGWGAPIVVGAVVGGLLVLRELAPYAAATERWVLIGLAGTVLTVAA